MAKPFKDASPIVSGNSDWKAKLKTEPITGVEIAMNKSAAMFDMRFMIAPQLIEGHYCPYISFQLL